ncbi:MAG: GtrA family protein [Dorea sp.]|nr:GtrA family protein [Dorea sp.]
MMKKVVDWVTVKFLIVGVINTLVGTSVMFLCYNILHTGYWAASALNYIIGSIVSYFLNKYFTFKSGRKSVREVLCFVLNITVCYGLSYGVAKPCVHYVLQGYSVAVRDNAAMFAGMCLFVVLNYFGQRFVVFRQEDR